MQKKSKTSSKMPQRDQFVLACFTKKEWNAMLRKHRKAMQLHKLILGKEPT